MIKKTVNPSFCITLVWLWWPMFLPGLWWPLFLLSGPVHMCRNMCSDFNSNEIIPNPGPCDFFVPFVSQVIPGNPGPRDSFVPFAFRVIPGSTTTTANTTATSRFQCDARLPACCARVACPAGLPALTLHHTHHAARLPCPQFFLLKPISLHPNTEAKPCKKIN